MMTPERKEEIKYSKSNVTWMTLQDYVSELLAALEETQQQNNRLEVKLQASIDSVYPISVERDEYKVELAEAQQTIARQQQDLIKSQTDADILLQMNRQLRKSIREGAKES
jgi:hypothetical protein